MVEQVEVDGINIAVDIQGSGDPVFIVHGVTHSKESMYSIRDVLADDFQTFTYDARGHGESDKPASYTLDDHYADLIGLADSFSFDKFGIVGLSMGSYIALGTAIKVPDRISKLVIMGTKGDGETSSVSRLADEQGKDVSNLSPKELQDIISENLYAPTTSDEIKEEVEKVTELYELTQEQTTAASQALSNFDFLSNLDKVTADTLVISGEYDKINPAEDGKKVADGIEGSEYLEVKDAGHVMHLEKPEEVNTKIHNFLLK